MSPAELQSFKFKDHAELLNATGTFWYVYNNYEDQFAKSFHFSHRRLEDGDWLLRSDAKERSSDTGLNGLMLLCSCSTEGEVVT